MNNLSKNSKLLETLAILDSKTPIEDDKNTILVVDDEDIDLKILNSILSPKYNVVLMRSGNEAIAYCVNTPPDLVLLDLHMPEVEGTLICKLLRHHKKTEHIPIIFITASDEHESQDACWEAGCVDFVNKPIVKSTLLHRVKAHLNAKLTTDKLRKNTFLDGLTGVYNRRYLDNKLESELQYAASGMEPLHFMMIDVDLFKQFNDSFGHLAGDQALKLVAHAISLHCQRPSDSLARFGGEEFGVLLPNTNRHLALKIGQKILHQVFSLQLTNPNSEYGVLTVSIGIAELPQNSSSIEEVIAIADKNLYEAKRHGKNRVWFT
ncbi:diguanylate cyclase [Aliiglaciecola sp. M165]|uniref:diguanylate cyclase n=1 Tax=Aliiglaciecola sp. M165 TaxID=2593649 RepID=UPI00163D40A6|nr:diguanylate cyclase [Aliiglaciecola sp. M165]